MIHKIFKSLRLRLPRIKFFNKKNSMNKEIEKFESSVLNYKLEDFELLEVLGKGSFGEVYKAILKKTGEIYAIKIVNNKFEKAVKKGLEKSSTICHPNIVRTYGYFKDKNTKNVDCIIIVMEFINGTNLMKAYKKDLFKISDIPNILNQILKGLKYIHDKGIIHRDLKLDNIIIDSQNKIKIIDTDFLIDVVSMNPNEKCGTPYFIPPEIYSCKKYINCSFDIWSLGVCIYILLTNTYPYDGDDIQDLSNSILHTDLNVSKIPSLYLHLIKGMLDKNNEKRMSTDDVISTVDSISF